MLSRHVSVRRTTNYLISNVPHYKPQCILMALMELKKVNGCVAPSTNDTRKVDVHQPRQYLLRHNTTITH